MEVHHSQTPTQLALTLTLRLSGQGLLSTRDTVQNQTIKILEYIRKAVSKDKLLTEYLRCKMQQEQRTLQRGAG